MVENHRGVVVEMGPMVTVLYVFMVGIPLIGSVPTTAPSNDSKPSEDSLAKEGSIFLFSLGFVKAMNIFT